MKKTSNETPDIRVSLAELSESPQFMRLSFHEQGVYFALILACIKAGGSIGADRESLAEALLVMPDEVASLVSSAVRVCFEEAGGKLTHRALQVELAKLQQALRDKAAAGRKSAEARRAAGKLQPKRAPRKPRSVEQVFDPAEQVFEKKQQLFGATEQVFEKIEQLFEPTEQMFGAVEQVFEKNEQLFDGQKRRISPHATILPYPITPSIVSPTPPSSPTPDPTPPPLPQSVLDLASRLAVLGLRNTHEAERLLLWLTRPAWAQHPPELWVAAIERWVSRSRDTGEWSPVQAIRKCLLGRSSRAGHPLTEGDLAAWIQTDADAIAAERQAAQRAAQPALPAEPAKPAESPIARLRRERAEATKAAKASAAAPGARGVSPMASESIPAPVAS